MYDLFHPGTVMCGSAVNGNTPVTDITGGKAPGKKREKAEHGNQDIGREIRKGTNGIREAGNNDSRGYA